MIKGLFFLLFLVILYNGCISREELTSSHYSSSYQPSKVNTFYRGYKTQKNIYYVVKKGDSLWSIAKKYNVKIEDLMRENNISYPATLKVGTKLVIPLNPLYKRDYGIKKSLFLWPVEGRIITYFGEKINNKKNKGIEIETEENIPVKAAEKGKVTFSDYIKGYGKTVIIRHYNNISTVYTNLSKILVKEGDYVEKGKAIGIVGKDSQKNIGLLHFEVRKSYKAQNPLIYLY